MTIKRALRRLLSAVLILATFLGSTLCLSPQFSQAAMTLSLGSQGGLMVQPSSQYYHGVYGGYLSLTSSQTPIQLQLNYLERPSFKASGFVDQEQGAFFFVGTQAAQHGLFSLTSFVGYGKIEGFIQAQSSLAKRTFALKGLAARLALDLKLSPVHLALAHQTLIGLEDREQTRAFVAWPYSFFLVSLGLVL